MTRFTSAKFKPTPRLRGVAKYLFELAIVGASYFVLARGEKTKRPHPKNLSA